MPLKAAIHPKNGSERESDRPRDFIGFLVRAVPERGKGWPALSAPRACQNGLPMGLVPIADCDNSRPARPSTNDAFGMSAGQTQRNETDRCPPT